MSSAGGLRFFSPVPGGPGQEEWRSHILHASAFETEERGVLAVAGGLFRCTMGANSLLVARLH